MISKAPRPLDPAEEWLAHQWLGDASSAAGFGRISGQIKHRIFEYLHKVQQDAGETGPPHNPEALFAARRIIDIQLSELPADSEGMLIPVDGGFLIKIPRSSHRSNRLRFTIAHEVGHTFFYDLGELRPSRRFNWAVSRRWVQEGYANEIAAEILLPEHSLKSFIGRGKLQPSLSSLQSLAKTFGVSCEALAHRLLRPVNHLTGAPPLWDCLIFFAEGQPDSTFATRVWKGMSFEFMTMPRCLKDNNAHPRQFRDIIYSTVVAASVGSGVSHSVLSIKGRQWRVESQSLATRDKPTVLSLITK